MMIDTHCHLNFEQYDEDREAVIQRAKEAGVTRIILPGVDRETCEQVLALTNEHPGIYCAVGVHPTSVNDFDDELLKVIEAHSYKEGVVAIGEIGLDYYWDKTPRDIQHTALKAQLALAAQRELPVIIHNRDSSDDLMEILENWVQTLPESLKDRPGVLHSFSAPPEIAERALAAGFYLGFTGPITFKKADELRQIAANVPLNRILVETDGPYLAPHPYRGKRNESSYIPYMVEKLAELKGISKEEMAAATTENAVRLFNLPDATN